MKMVGFEASFRRGSSIWNTSLETRTCPHSRPPRCRVVTHFEVDRTRKVDVNAAHTYRWDRVIVLAALNGITWLVGMPWLHDLNVFSAGFVLGMLGMYIAAWLYGYRRVN